jgi:hypothetical protein
MSVNSCRSVLGGLKAVVPLALAMTVAACGDRTLLAPEDDDLMIEEVRRSCEPMIEAYEAEYQVESDPGCGGGGGGTYDTSYDYGYYSTGGGYSYDWDVNYYQQAAYDQDLYAFDQYYHNWDDPDAVAFWAPAVVAGVTAAARAGRALARTSRIRQAVTSGARWARDVSVAVAAALLVGGWQMAYDYAPEDIAVSEFDFMFDYAVQ